MVEDKSRQKNKQNQQDIKREQCGMNSSSLSVLKNRNITKQNNSSSLPPISTGQTLKYQNDYQSYEDDLQDFKKKQSQQPAIEEHSESKNNSIFSSSLSSSRKSNISQRRPSKPSVQMTKSQQSRVQKSAKNILFYEQSPTSLPTKPHIQNSERDEYRNILVEQIERQVKMMRKQLQDMNHKLSEQLNQYNMAKSQFTPKEVSHHKKLQFYQTQIQTNKKVQQTQLAQIKKLNQTQLLIKDKDVLIDLQNIMIELRQQIHHATKQQHDSRLKNHKKNLFLDQIIQNNSDDKNNNAVKLLRLQIIYYMKRQNSLKTYEQQLDHEEKLIRQNDKNLKSKVQQIKKQHKMYHFCDQNHIKLIERHSQLVDKKKLLQKHIQTLKNSFQITQEKLARQILQIDTILRTVIPQINSYQDTSQQIQHKITAITTAYKLNEASLKNIKYKFLQDFTYAKNNQTNPFTKNTFKPTLRPRSKIQQHSFLTETKQHNTISNQKLIKQNNTKSNQKLNQIHRYNDKNISMNIDVNLQNDQKFRSISGELSNLKPKNFRIFTKRQHNNVSQLDKHTSFSTVDYGPNLTKSIDKNIQIQTTRLLKPNLLLSKANTKR